MLFICFVLKCFVRIFAENLKKNIMAYIISEDCIACGSFIEEDPIDIEVGEIVSLLANAADDIPD